MKTPWLLLPLIVGSNIPCLHGQSSVELEQEPVADIPFEDVISDLPAIGSERRWDPGTDAYVLHPSIQRIKDLVEADRLTDEQWRQALLVSKAIRTRSKWPTGRPYAVSMRMPAWVGLHAQIRINPRGIRLSSATVGLLSPTTCGTFASGMAQAALYQEMGRLPVGEHELVFDITVERGQDPDEPRASVWPWRSTDELWSGTMVVPVEIVQGIDEAIPPVSDDALDQAVRSSIGLAFWNEREKRRAVLVLDPDETGFHLLAKTALSLRVEVLEGEDVRQTLELAPNCWDPQDLSNWGRSVVRPPIAIWCLDSLPVASESDQEGMTNWSLRITGTQKYTHYLWDAERTWVGQVVVPLAEARAKEIESAGPSGREPWTYSPRFHRELGWPWGAHR